MGPDYLQSGYLATQVNTQKGQAFTLTIGCGCACPSVLPGCGCAWPSVRPAGGCAEWV